MKRVVKVNIELLNNEFYYTDFCHKAEVEKALSLLHFYGIIKYYMTDKDVLILN